MNVTELQLRLRRRSTYVRKTVGIIASQEKMSVSLTRRRGEEREDDERGHHLTSSTYSSWPLIAIASIDCLRITLVD